MTDMSIGALILAAGLSTRMGEFKPLLTIGSETFLGHTISLFLKTGIDDIVVVTGHDSENIQRELDRYPCRSVFNKHYTEGMFSSIQVGVKGLSPVTKAFFLLPVDIPLVRPDTINALIQERQRSNHSSSQVIYPEYQRRRGHPPLISCDLISAIQNYKDQGGLRALLKRYQQQSRSVAVDDPFILLDADTQKDLDLLKKHNQTR